MVRSDVVYNDEKVGYIITWGIGALTKQTQWIFSFPFRLFNSNYPT